MVAAPPLGSNEGLSEQGAVRDASGRFSDPQKGCPRWPEGLWLRWIQGELSGFVQGRCKSTNLCAYCAIQSAHENARMLSLDAIDGQAPE
jgi:hypothetical protein